MLNCHFERLLPKKKPKINKYLRIPTELNRFESMRCHTKMIFGLQCISNPYFIPGQDGFKTVKILVMIQTKIDLHIGTQIAIIKTKYCHPQVGIISKKVVLECDTKEVMIFVRFNDQSGLSICDIVKDLRAKVLFL